MVTDESPNGVQEAVETARRNQPWNAEAIRELVAFPAESRQDATACEECEDKPCRDDEICATMVVHELALMEEMGRSQAFHLVESGMKRVRLQTEASIRHEDRIRPNTFIAGGYSEGNTADTAGKDPNSTTNG